MSRTLSRILAALALSAIIVACTPAAAGTPQPATPTTTARPVPVTVASRLAQQGWSVEQSLSGAAARIEAATLMREAVEQRDIDARLAEIAAAKAAAQRRLADLTPPDPTTTAPSAPQPIVAADPGSVWDRLAGCESGGRWDYNGSSGYDGGLQFHPGTWNAYSGGVTAYAWQATREQQIAAAERLLAASGGRFTAWPGCRAKLGLP